MDSVKEKLVELLSKYFDIGDSYAYNLTRDKAAFGIGTMSLDDFEEFDEETVADIADHLIADGWTKQEWISVKDRLPEEPLQTVLVTNGKETCVAVYSVVYDEFGVMCGKGKAFGVTHWMPLPQPPKGETHNE